MHQTSLSLFKQGGPLMWPLLILGIIGLTLALERTIYLHKGKIRAAEFLAGIKNLLRKRRLIEALTVCEETPAPVANIIKAALINYNQPEEKMIAAVQSAALVQIPHLERRVNTLAMIAKVAPLIGFLATVLALYGSFALLNVEGPYANSAIFSQYIAQSLIATATGLFIAIIAWLFHHFLSGRIRALVHDMEWVGHDILQFLLRDLPEEEEPPSSN